MANFIEVCVLHGRSVRWESLEKIPQVFQDYSMRATTASLHTFNSILNSDAPPLLCKHVVLVCDPSLLDDLDSRRERLNVFFDQMKHNHAKLVILRKNGVSIETIHQMMPQLKTINFEHLCLDEYLNRDEEVEKIVEAIFLKLFGYLPSLETKDDMSSNEVWNSPGCLAANQVPINPPCVNQNPPDAGSLGGCVLRDNSESNVTREPQQMEINDPPLLRERPEEFRCIERTVEILRSAAYSKSESIQRTEDTTTHIPQPSMNQNVRPDLLPLSGRSQTQRTGFPVEVSLQNDGDCAIKSPAFVPPYSGTFPSGNPSGCQPHMMRAQEAPGYQAVPGQATNAAMNGFNGNRQFCPSNRQAAVHARSGLPSSNYHDERMDIGVASGGPAITDHSPSPDNQNEKVRDLPEEMLFELSMYLDPSECGLMNWRCFASHLGVKGKKIDYLEFKGEPTRAMLKLSEFRNCTVRQFKELCGRFKRIDVKEDVFEAFDY